MLNDETENTGYYSATGNNYVDGQFNECIVQCVGIASTLHYDNLIKNCCDCNFVRQHKFVCRNVLCAIQLLQLDTNVMNQYIDKCCFVSSITFFYGNKNVTLPKLDKLDQNTKINPSPWYTQAGGA
jgi:hypothetical protein